MPDVVGSAVYSLELDGSQFDTKLRQAEANFKRAQGNIASTGSALATGGGAGIVAAEEKIAVAGQKAAVGTQVLRQAVSQTTQQLSSSVPIMTGFGTAVGTASTALPLLGAGLIAGYLGFTALNAVVERFTGGSLIEYLTGATAAHKLATAAAKEQGDILDRISRIRREGVTAGTARDLALAASARVLTQAYKDRDIALEESARRIAAIEQLRPPTPLSRTPVPGATPTPGFISPQADQAQAKFKADLQAATDEFLKAKAPLRDYYALIQQFPEVRGVKTFADDLKLQEEAAGAAGVALAKYEVIVGKVLQAQAEFSSSFSDLKDIGDVLDPQLEALKLEQIQLEQLKTKMGDAFGEANQARLEEVTRLVSLLKDRQEIATQSVALFAAQVQQAYGALAPAAIENVAAALSRLPADQQIAIKILLPDLFPIQSAFAAFIAALQAGASVTIAIRAASVAGFGTAPVASQGFLGGAVSGLPGFNPEAFPSDAALNFEQQLADKLNNLNQNAVGPLGAQADKTTGKVGSTKDSLAELAAEFAAFHEATGGSIEDFRVLLQIAQDNIDLNHRQEEAAIALRVAAAEAADGSYQLRLGFVEIAEAAVAAGVTVPEIVGRIFSSIKENAQSVLDSILNQPTREGTELKLKLDTLERQRLILLRNRKPDDPAVKAIDKQISSLQNEVEIRQKDIDIMRDHAILANQQLATDRTLVNAYVFLIAIIKNVSLALNNLVGPLGGFGAAASGGFHSGLTIVGEKGPELLDLGSGVNVIPADVTSSLLNAPRPQLTAGLDLGALDFRVPNFTPTQSGEVHVPGENSYSFVINAASDAEETARRVIKKIDDRDRARQFSGATASRHSYTPR